MSRCRAYVCLCVFALQASNNEFLQHSKESWGVLGQAGKDAGKQAGKQTAKKAGKQAAQQAGKQAGKQAGEQAGKQAGKHLAGIQSEPCPVGTCFIKVFVPLTYDGVKGWIFNLVCPGNAMSVTHEGLLLLKSATVNRNLVFDDVCNEKHVFVAYKNEPWVFEVSNITGEMVRYPVEPYVRYYNVAWEWEIQAAFFKYNNNTPHWIDANGTMGTLNYTTGQWSGAVGLIQRDEADYAIGTFAVTHPRSEVAAFSPGTDYMPYYWLTRYPQELTPMWNLFGLFTKGYNSIALCRHQFH